VVLFFVSSISGCKLYFKGIVKLFIF